MHVRVGRLSHVVALVGRRRDALAIPAAPPASATPPASAAAPAPAAAATPAAAVADAAACLPWMALKAFRCTAEDEPVDVTIRDEEPAEDKASNDY